jgi:anti-sigma factor RsiW
MHPTTAQIEAFLDGETSASEMRELDAHLRACSSCAANVLSQVQIKRAVSNAGKRFAPSRDFRERVRKSIAAKPQRSPMRALLTGAVAVAAMLVIGVVATSVNQHRLQREQVFREIADLHVATLASANPVDVISTDRHTVKPWFQGKLPFTFNLPELQNSEFTLIGGRMSYLEAAPGAELIYQIRKHQISVFVFQSRAAGSQLGTGSWTTKESSFNLETWGDGDLRYFVMGDASADDIRALSDMLRKVE